MSTLLRSDFEREVVDDPYTVSRRTARQAAEGLYKACITEMWKMKKAVTEIESMMGRRQ